MPLSFKCKCGAPLKASDDEAGKKLQCPTCGRVVVVPAPAEPAVNVETAAWQTDASETAATRAEEAGIIRRGRAGVIRLHAARKLSRDLVAKGVFTCWHCRTENSFSGQIFGRAGLGGAFADVSCRKCNASIPINFSSHATGPGTDVFLWSPSHTRDYQSSGNNPLPAPSYRITHIVEVPLPKTDDIHACLPAFIQAVQDKVTYKELSPLAANLVALRFPDPHREVVCKAMRMLLEKDQPTYISALLAEALACLRDETAAEVVEYALQQALAADDATDATNMPLHDLCVLALLFGDRNGFQNALELGFKELAITTRAYRWDKRLTPQELAELLQEGNTIDSYQSTLGGTDWQRVYPLLPLREEAKKAFGSKWFKKFFGKK